MLPLSLEQGNQFSHLVELIEPSRERNELVLSPQNNDILEALLNEFRHADILRRHGLINRSRILLCGPPGTGKTLTAEILARQIGLPLYVAKIDAIISSFLGETASNVRKLFDAANQQACVLFLDEFDALARARISNDEHNELRRVVNSLLMMIDRYSGRGLLVAATNLEEALDSAIWRRFDDVLFFD
ncbi:MAG: ATP-binding protein, partial [Xanthobacteraceae bacterium]